LLAKNLTPTRGHVEHASRLRIGWFAQHFADQLQTDMSPVMYLHEKYPEHEYETLRKYLGMFGLPGKRHLQAIQTLSGGEKNRVVFASIALYGAHLLFLDEPTNHLDMESIAALVKGVKKFTGGVVLVSHDQRLISAACEEIWVVDDQTVETYVQRARRCCIQLGHWIGIAYNDTRAQRMRSFALGSRATSTITARCSSTRWILAFSRRSEPLATHPHPRRHRLCVHDHANRSRPSAAQF